MSEPQRGLGDTVAAITHATGIDKATEWVSKNVTKKPCGCKGRQNALNRMVPYRRSMVDPPTDERSWG